MPVPENTVALRHAVDDPEKREVHQRQLRTLREELEAEGADGGAILDALLAEAKSWPE